MKLTTTLAIVICALGSNFAFADRHHDHRRDCGHCHKTGSHDEHTSGHHRVAISNERNPGYDDQAHRRGADFGRVIEVEPVYRYYKEPVNARSCIRYEQRPRTYTSYTGTVLGAVVGAALGHRVGDSHGDPTAAAVAGGLLGAAVGRDIHHRTRQNSSLRVEGPCQVRQQEQTLRQLVEYKVTYRYNGEVHHARMDYDPGEWVKLDVDVTPA